MAELMTWPVRAIRESVKPGSVEAGDQVRSSGPRGCQADSFPVTRQWASAASSRLLMSHHLGIVGSRAGVINGKDGGSGTPKPSPLPSIQGS
jgi:hypothetical protein